jgi:hypothetical protein
LQQRLAGIFEIDALRQGAFEALMFVGITKRITGYNPVAEGGFIVRSIGLGE